MTAGINNARVSGTLSPISRVRRARREGREEVAEKSKTVAPRFSLLRSVIHRSFSGARAMLLAGIFFPSAVLACKNKSFEVMCAPSLSFSLRSDSDAKSLLILYNDKT